VQQLLGLSSHPKVIEAAHKAIERTVTECHRPLHLRHAGYSQGAGRKISSFLGTEGTILYAAAFDANWRSVRTFIQRPGWHISDELNHASIIDGVRLCKAQRLRYKHNNME
jgi:glycine C-acetyltransferase